MAQPQLRGYTDLTVYDVLPADLVDRAVQDAAAKWPEWAPREGNTELALIETLSLVVAELAYSINRVPAGVAEILVRLFGVTRSLGVAPTTTVTFALADSLGHTVPSGTTVRLDLGPADGTVDLVTDVDATALPGENSVTVAATALTKTAQANSTPAGTDLELVSAIPYVDSVELATPVAGGVDAETEDEWLDRAVAQFSRLSSALVLPEHFETRALEEVTVDRARHISNYDPDAVSGLPGDHLGHITIAVLGPGGALVASADRDALEATLEELAQVNLDVHVVDPTITPVDVTVTVRRFADYDDATVTANVEAALAAYLDPETWDWDDTVAVNELIPVIDAAAGVDLVVDLSAPAADITLPGAAPLATVGAVTITVTAP